MWIFSEDVDQHEDAAIAFAKSVEHPSLNRPQIRSCGEHAFFSLFLVRAKAKTVTNSKRERLPLEFGWLPPTDLDKQISSCKMDNWL